MEPITGSPSEPTAIDRRSLLRRGAVAGGIAAWSTPLVQTVTSPAFAAGSPLCDTKVEVDDCVHTYVASVDCCECVEAHPNLSPAAALAACTGKGRCVEDTVVCGDQDKRDDKDANQSLKPTVPTVIPAGS